MTTLESDHATAVDTMRKLNIDSLANSVEPLPRPNGFSFGKPNQQRKRVLVTVDVEELQCPIELEVGSDRFWWREGMFAAGLKYLFSVDRGA